MLELLVQAQAAIRTVLSEAIKSFADGRDWAALLGLLPLGIVFGAAHALTPGHGKTVLSTYAVGSNARSWSALVTALALTLTHVGGAVVLAVVANTLVTRTIVGAGRAPALETISQVLLCIVGLWLVARAAFGRSHVHGVHIAAGIVAGLIPCPLTLFLTFYALSLGVLEAGLVFAAAMVGGVGLVLGSVSVASVWSRDALLAAMARHGAAVAMMVRAVDAAAGALLVLLAVLGLVG
jgi:nickel/cobalt transporter (NicO) family protein